VQQGSRVTLVPRAPADRGARMARRKRTRGLDHAGVALPESPAARARAGHPHHSLLRVRVRDNLSRAAMHTPARRHVSIVFLAALLALRSADAAAQVLPSEPLTLGTSWLTLGADVSASASCASVQGNTSHCTTDTGFFNYTDY